MAFYVRNLRSFDLKAVPSVASVPKGPSLVNPINTDSYVRIADAGMLSLRVKVRPRSDMLPFILMAQADKKPAATIPAGRLRIPASAPASQPERSPRIATFHSSEEVRRYLELMGKAAKQGAVNFETLKAARILVLFGNREEKRTGLNALIKMTKSDDDSFRVLAGRFLVLEGYGKIDENLRHDVAEGLLVSTNEKERRLGERILIELAFNAKGEDLRIKSADILVAYTQVSKASSELGIKALYKTALSAKTEERRFDVATMLLLSVHEAAIKKGVAAMRNLAKHTKSDEMRSRALRSLGEFQK